MRSSNTVMLGVQRAPIACQLLGIVVYGFDQAIGRDASHSLEDEYFRRAAS
jgi:hypothetical protein